MDKRLRKGREGEGGELAISCSKSTTKSADFSHKEIEEGGLTIFPDFYLFECKYVLKVTFLKQTQYKIFNLFKKN